MTTEIEIVKDAEVPEKKVYITQTPWATLVETLHAAQDGKWARLPMSMWPGSSRLRVQQLVQSAMYSKKPRPDPRHPRIHFCPPETRHSRIGSLPHTNSITLTC